MQLFMKMSLDVILIYYLDMQLIVHWTLYRSNLPPNVLIYFKHLKNLINFEFLNIDFFLGTFIRKGLTINSLIQKMRGKRVIVPKSLESTGMRSGNMLTNMSQVLIIVAVFLVTSLLMTVAYYMSWGNLKVKIGEILKK